MHLLLPALLLRRSPLLPPRPQALVSGPLLAVQSSLMRDTAVWTRGVYAVPRVGAMLGVRQVIIGLHIRLRSCGPDGAVVMEHRRLHPATSCAANTWQPRQLPILARSGFRCTTSCWPASP